MAPKPLKTNKLLQAIVVLSTAVALRLHLGLVPDPKMARLDRFSLVVAFIYPKKKG